MMDRPGRNNRRVVRFLAGAENLEDRQLLSQGSWPSYISRAELFALLHNPVGNPAVRPNTPVMPYGAASKVATYIDPTVHINNGYAVIVSSPGFIGQYATLDAHGGIIKIGTNSAILDNASIVANPLHPHTAPEVLIGNQVLLSYGAQVLGPSTIGSYSGTAIPVEIGSGALIDGATIGQGSIVSALARVGPGVTVPSGYVVLPGMNVTTNQEASNPALGKVAKITTAQLTAVAKLLSSNLALAYGYNQLYQGQSATGASPGVDPSVTGINNGNLSAIEGTSQQPGSPTASTPYLPPGSAPKFPSPHQGLVPGRLFGFRARVTGGTIFNSRAASIAHSVGRGNSIRADQGQPIAIGSIGRTGNNVTINSPQGGQLTIGDNLIAGNNAVILSGGTVKAAIGNNVTIGNGAVVDQSSLGDGSMVGDRAYVFGSTFPAGTNIPAGAIYINNKLVGSVAW
jgi:carbonic anhydrase/acetyltransferase-like protein (isoleucine patch superfamily)